MKQKSLTREQLIAFMKRQKGDKTDRDYAAELGISPPHLCDIFQGKRDPGPQLLQRLGFQRKHVFERTA